MSDNNNESKDLQDQEETRGTTTAAPLTENQLQARRAIVEFNASRGGKPHLKHGVNAVIRTGEVPPVPGAAEAAERVDALLHEAVSDLGGEHAVTAGRRAILASQRLALLVLELASQYLATAGLLDAKGKPHPLLSIVNSYANTTRLNAISLGLERQPKTVDATLEEVIAEHAGSES